jgi:DUF4097 and DUF4098 domain-containing protein YvlB
MFDIRSGNMDITVQDLTGDLSLLSTSGLIDVTMKRDMAFILDAETRSGNISAPGLKTRSNAAVRHTVGSDPVHTIFAQNRSGNITVR